MERSATCMFGLRQYGVDVNGYIKDENDQISVWLQKRSVTKPTWPGRWDNFVRNYYIFFKSICIHTYNFLKNILKIRYLEDYLLDIVSEKQ